MVFRNSVLRSLTTLTLLIASVLFAANLTVHSLQANASSSTTTTTDYAVPQSFDPWGTAMSQQGYLWVAVPGCDPTPMCSPGTPAGRFDIFNPTTSTWTAGQSLPANYAQPFFLVFDKLGRVWFPMPMDNSIGMYNPTNNSFSKWAVPTPNAGPWDIAIDRHGMIWFTEHFSNKIGRFNPTNHSFMEVSTPSTSSQPYGITVDATNNIWFTENNSSVALIAKYTTRGKLKEYKIRTSIDNNLTPHLITVAPNGNIWWTEGFVGKIGELNIAQAKPGTNNGVKEYTYQQLCNQCGTHTSGIGIDSNGLVWFDDSLQSTFGSFPDSGLGSFSMYTTPTSNSHPHDGLMVDSHNRVWFDEEFGNKIACAITA